MAGRKGPGEPPWDSPGAEAVRKATEAAQEPLEGSRHTGYAHEIRFLIDDGVRSPHRPMLTVDIASLSEGIHHVEFTPVPEAVDLDPSTFRDLQVEAELQYHRDRILVKLRAAATATLTCDRTLKEYDQPVAGSYNLLFGPPEMVGQEGDEFEEVRPLTPSDNELDLTDVVRDTLVLSLPQRRIAPDAEDESIEQVFGAPAEEEASDEPVDPRWSELKKLRDAEHDEGENTAEERQF